MPRIQDELKEPLVKKLSSLVTLDVKDAVVKKFIDDAHECVLKHFSRIPSDFQFGSYVNESHIFKMFARDARMTARTCADKLNKEYGTAIQENFIIRLFGEEFTQSMRESLFRWANDTATIFVQTLMSRNPQRFKDYKKILPRNPRDSRDRVLKEQANLKRRVLVLTLYTKYPQLDVYGDAERLEKFGYVYAKHFLTDINDLLKNICEAQDTTKPKNSTQNEIERLKGALEKNEILLKDLQEDFDARLQANHQNEMIDFFSGLNSERYGRILDEIISARNGIQQLRKQKVELPIEISGLFILIDKLSKFVRDNKINPIMRLGSIHEMKLSEIESCDYEGSPYVNADDVKRVKVLSPGWFYKSKEIQIARPRLRECAEDELD